MNHPMIEVKGLSKKYRISHEQKAGYRSFRDDLAALFTKPLSLVTGKRETSEEFWALNDISFSVERGEVLGIIGRNGSGKSTLLKILSRITDPTSGTAILRGKTASLLEVGTGFHPELTGRENIYFNGSILGMSKREITRKFAEIVAFAEVEKFLDTPVKFYSSGMYVRLAFAVAAHLEPEVLIVDEVLAVGDAQFQKKCLGKMKTVSKEGRTVLFVSHNMETVRQLCNRVILLENGKISSDGSTTQVTNQYSGHFENAKSSFQFEPISGKEAQFSELKILDSAGRPSSVIKAGQPWNLSIDYQINQPLRNALLIVEVQSDGYETIYFTSDSDQASEILPKVRGKYHAEINFDRFHLNPGNYFMRVSLQSPGQSMYHEVNDLSLTIEPNPSDIRGGYFGGRYFGFTYDKVDWQTTKL